MEYVVVSLSLNVFVISSGLDEPTTVSLCTDQLDYP